MDRKLVGKAIRGNKKAYSRLIEEVKVEAYRIAYYYLKHEADASDALCSAIEKAYVQIGKLQDERKFKGWFVRIVVNECKMLIRKNQKVVFIDEYDKTPEQHQVGFEKELIHKVDLEKAIDQLMDDEQEIIYMKYYEGYTFLEIHQVTGMPVSTVKTKNYSIIKKLKGMLDCEVEHVK